MVGERAHTRNKILDSVWVSVILSDEYLPRAVVYMGQVMLSKELLVYKWYLKFVGDI